MRIDIAPVACTAMNSELGEDGARDRADEVAVQAREWVDARKQPGREAVRDALKAQHQPGDAVGP